MAGTKLDPVDLLTEPVQVTGRLLQRPRVPPPRPWADLEDPSEGSSSPTPSTTSSVPSSPSSVDSPVRVCDLLFHGHIALHVTTLQANRGWDCLYRSFSKSFHPDRDAKSKRR